MKIKNMSMIAAMAILVAVGLTGCAYHKGSDGTTFEFLPNAGSVEVYAPGPGYAYCATGPAYGVTVVEYRTGWCYWSGPRGRCYGPVRRGGYGGGYYGGHGGGHHR